MTDITTASPALIPFTSRHEGRVHKAYRDAGGVITIGDGFTGLSKTFAAWWKASRGHALRLGDTITDAECDLLLGKLLDEEYAPPVVDLLAGKNRKQCEADCAIDVTYNCGAGSLKWRWATDLADGLIKTAADKLRRTAVTAGGKRLAGLVRRRADEAKLMQTGDYGDAAAAPSVSASADDVKVYQAQIATLGLYKGAIDGKAGPATVNAVEAFQRANGLIVDGKVGPATRAELARAVEAKSATQVGTATTAGGATAGGGTEAARQAGQIDWHTLITAAEWGLAIGTVVLVAYLVWRNRGVILRQRTPT